MTMPLRNYGVIFSHADQPECGHLAYVAAIDPKEAVDRCWEAVEDDGGIWEGCDFTVSPVPCN